MRLAFIAYGAMVAARESNERRPGLRAQNEPLPFFPVCRAGRHGAANREKGEAGYRVVATQGGGLGGLALGYYRAAPPGRRTGESDSAVASV